MKFDDNQAVLKFARQIYRDIQAYVVDHQAEFEEWLKNQHHPKPIRKKDSCKCVQP